MPTLPTQLEASGANFVSLRLPYVFSESELWKFSRGSAVARWPSICQVVCSCHCLPSKERGFCLVRRPMVSFASGRLDSVPRVVRSCASPLGGRIDGHYSRMASSEGL